MNLPEKTHDFTTPVSDGASLKANVGRSLPTAFVQSWTVMPGSRKKIEMPLSLHRLPGDFIVRWWAVTAWSNLHHDNKEVSIADMQS